MAAGLLTRGGYRTHFSTIPLVSGGIVFDFGQRDNSIYPDKRLGRPALDAAVPGRFPLPARGAGISFTVGNGLGFDRGEPSGEGAAFRDIRGVKVFAYVVLNAVGAAFDRDGKLVRGHLDPHTGQRSSLVEDLERYVDADPEPGNTTLTVVVTNRTVVGHDLTQLARQVHSSMARAIQPFHTRSDGDALLEVSTREVNPAQWSLSALGVAASEVVWDAVLAGPSVALPTPERLVAAFVANGCCRGATCWQPLTAVPAAVSRHSVTGLRMSWAGASIARSCTWTTSSGRNVSASAGCHGWRTPTGSGSGRGDPPGAGRPERTIPVV